MKQARQSRVAQDVLEVAPGRHAAPVHALPVGARHVHARPQRLVGDDPGNRAQIGDDVDAAGPGLGLGVIGAFNVLGSLFFGWAGGRWSKQVLLGLIYISRSIVLGWYFALPPTPTSTLAFAAIMGFLWLGVGLLVAGSVVELFGLKWQAMIQGLAFMSHQLGSFMGAFGGGLIFDSFQSYDLAWRIGVALGLTAGAVQVIYAAWRTPRPAPA